MICHFRNKITFHKKYLRNTTYWTDTFIWNIWNSPKINYNCNHRCSKKHSSETGKTKIWQTINKNFNSTIILWKLYLKIKINLVWYHLTFQTLCVKKKKKISTNLHLKSYFHAWFEISRSNSYTEIIVEIWFWNTFLTNYPF